MGSTSRTGWTSGSVTQIIGTTASLLKVLLCDVPGLGREAEHSVHDGSTLLRELHPEPVDRLLALAGPDADCPQVIVELWHLGGALQRDPAHASAFAHRDAAYALATIGIGVPPLLDPTVTHWQAVRDAVAPWSTGGILPNSSAGSDASLVAGKYPGPTLARLATLVASYDPAGVFPDGRAVVAAHSS